MPQSFGPLRGHWGLPFRPPVRPCASCQIDHLRMAEERALPKYPYFNSRSAVPAGQVKASSLDVAMCCVRQSSFDSVFLNRLVTWRVNDTAALLVLRVGAQDNRARVADYTARLGHTPGMAGRCTPGAPRPRHPGPRCGPVVAGSRRADGTVTHSDRTMTKDTAVFR